MRSGYFVAFFAVLTIAVAMVFFDPSAQANPPGALPALLAPAGIPGQQAPPGPAPTSFKRAVSYLSGGYGALAVAVADVDEDGHPDLVAVGGTCYECVTSQVSVLRGNGDGTFQTAVSYPAGYQAYDVAVADLNGDGHLDLVIADWCSSSPDPNCGTGGAVSVLLGKGDGTFQTAVSYASGASGARSVVVADVNRDGKPDLVVANYCLDTTNCSVDGAVSVLLGNGDGTFQAAKVYDSGGIYTTSVAVGDVNGDGNPDLVVANAGQCSTCANGGLSVFMGNGDGSFRPFVSYNVGASETMSVAIGDVNGDGHPDLVAASACQTFPNCNPGVVGVMLNNGDGTFGAPTNYSSGAGGARGVVIGDVNGDGKPDIMVAASKNKGAIGVLVGNGNGTFLPSSTFNSGGFILAGIAAADVNGDGKMDLLAANVCIGGSCSKKTALGSVGVLLNNFVAVTSTTVTSSPNPSKVNQPVTFTATLESAVAVPDGSSVTFYVGTTQLGSGTTAKGVATLTTSFSKATTYAVKAKYAGDSYHKQSSGMVKEVVTN